MLTELLAFLDELLSYLESVHDVRGEEGRESSRPESSDGTRCYERPITIISVSPGSIFKS